MESKLARPKPEDAGWAMSAAYSLGRDDAIRDLVGFLDRVLTGSAPTEA